MSGVVPGELCWAELATPDEKAALAFYSAVFGWTATEREMRPPGGTFAYAFLHLGERFVGGMYRLQPAQRAAGVAPHWLPYLAVESADEATRRAERLGATCLLDPTTILGAGRVSLLEDPCGAGFALMQAVGVAGFRVGGEPGTACWIELAAADPAKAAEFYRALFGWRDARAPAGGPDSLLVAGDRPMAGIARPRGDGSAASWRVHFAVAECEPSCARILAARGKVERAPADVSGVGVSAAAVDALGAAFSILVPRLPG